ncbi:MAG: hypothetical protein QOI26_427 [Pseudonocardiales bacterium]|nr:hypothetical protein [Pseudonocardiales bacterium]
MSQPFRHRLSTGTAVAAGILLAVPIIALLWVPIYARKDPELWGIPFFYWYQMVWVIACGFCTGGAYQLVQRDRRRGDR